MEMTETVQAIDCSKIRQFEQQPRQYFDQPALESLLESIREYGQEKPGEVRTLSEGETYRYELIDGERRWRCCTLLGIPFKAVVRSDITDVKSQFLASFLANGGQENLTDLENVKSIVRIKQEHGLTNKQVAYRIGRSEDWVSERAALAKLGPKIMEMMSPEREDRLSFSHASLLLRVGSSRRDALAEIVVRDGLKTSQLRDLTRRDRQVEAKPGYEYVKFTGMLRRLLEDSQALKEKGDNLRRIMKSRPNREISNAMARVGQISENLATLREALNSLLKTRVA
ncbi:MAG: ParB/RepB/Spo0J family partition protein [Candidatus Doudnabacteria bacterium]|nr:ParB/RepB/Spo0J family partition protein [Candidatus Doudnabacteria bacterium]